MIMRPMRRTALLFCALLPLASSLAAAPLTLRGGSFATIERPAALPSGAEEWEAFLSLDGGRYYAFRITPHLDVARREFAWLVPNVDTTSARILIRAGDERHETLIELPAAFAIRRDARAAVPRATLVPGRGEAARAGDPAVAMWTDGDRAGGAVVVRTSESRQARLSVYPEPAPEPEPEPVVPLINVRPHVVASRTTSRPTQRAQHVAHAQDILLISTRLNV